jgi:hypothetical protein
MKLTTETKDHIYTTEFKNIDVDLEQLFDSFKSHLIALSWKEETINQFIVEWANELKDI